MRVVVDGTAFEGPAVDLGDRAVDADALLAAIRAGGPDDGGAGGQEHDDGRARGARPDAGGRVTVEAPSPHPVHERVGYVREGMGLRVRTALAAAARSRGLSAPQDEELARLRERLDAMDPPVPETAPQRRAVAEADDTDELLEEVAELRGRVTALEERDVDTDDLRAELAAVTRRLTERETERVAARQELDRAARAARSARDARERRLRLEDRVANLARDARAHLVERVAGAFADAVASAPGSGSPGDPFAAEPVTAALAVARVADVAAPVVLACDRFPTAEAAAAWLDGPVVRL